MGDYPRSLTADPGSNVSGFCDRAGLNGVIDEGSIIGAVDGDFDVEGSAAVAVIDGRR